MGRRADHPGHIQERGESSYRVTLRIQGERKRYTVKGSRRDAENFARTKYQELERRTRRGGADAIAGKTFVSDLLDRFERDEIPTLAAGTQESYGAAVKIFRLYFVDQRGDPELEQLGRADIKGFLSWRKGFSLRKGRDNVSAHTVACDLRVLHRMLNYAVDLELVSYNAASRVKAPKPDERTPVILSPDEFHRLLEAAGREDRPMLWLYLLLLSETGLRSASEALHLRWEDIDLQEGFLQVRSGRDGHRTKTGKSRWVPLTPRLRAALQEHAARFRMATYDGKRSPWVFHQTRTRAKYQAGDRRKSFRTAFEAARRRAKLPADLRQHDLRHRRVTTWLAEGANPVHVKEAVGHASLATTMKYTHLAREHLRSLVDQGDDERRRMKEDLGA